MMELSTKWVERRSGIDALRKNDNRDPYERDHARMINSASFRKLQVKTKLTSFEDTDFNHSRLTHSLDVAQIGSGIVKHLSKNSLSDEWKKFLPSHSLIETICLAHELGHPPFGHGGEIALNHMMRGIGGFEENGQTLRIISKLEKYTEDYGLDLTRRSMLGVLKYPINYSQLLSSNHKNKYFISESFENHRQVIAHEWIPPKCYLDEDSEVVEWLLEPFSDDDKFEFLRVNKVNGVGVHDESSHKSFDTTILELSDDITNGIHDLEYAISLKFITKDIWNDIVHEKLISSGTKFNGLNIENIRDKLFSTKIYERKEMMSCLINWLITSVKVKTLDNFEDPLLKYRAYFSSEEQAALKILKNFVKEYVVKRSEVQMLEYKGQQMVMAIFDAIVSDPNRLLPHTTKDTWEKYREDKVCESGSRVICDYVSGMSDDFAAHTYSNLFAVG